MSSRPTPSPPLSTTTSPSPRRPTPDDDKLAPPSEFSSGPPPPPYRSPALPGREDCWSEEATRTLIDAWGAHHLQLNRGNLRQKHWQEVADAVNALHATSAKLRRTDVQCKNRIDTTKKKYKIEKSKAVQSNGRYVSTWAHFESLDSLIGDSFSKTHSSTTANGHSRSLRRRVSRSPESSPSPSPPPPLRHTATHHRKTAPVSHHLEDKDPATSPLLKLPWSVPVGPRSKRSGAGSVTERNFSVMAAAAAAMEAEEDEEDDDEDGSGTWRRGPHVRGRKRKGAWEEEGTIVGDGFRRLAEAIGSLAQIYQNVEEAKQRQMVELEKQRMQFAKDLEIQRMKVFMESQVHLEKLKRAKRSSENNSYL